MAKQWRKVGLGTARRNLNVPAPKGEDKVISAGQAIRPGSPKCSRSRCFAPSQMRHPTAAISPRGLATAVAAVGPPMFTQHRLPQPLLTKKPSRCSVGFLSCETFCAKLFQDGARPWAAQARARGPGQGAASARGTRAEDDPGTAFKASATAPPPTTLYEGNTSADLDAGGPRNLKNACIRPDGPPKRCSESSAQPGRRPPRTRRG